GPWPASARLGACCNSMHYATLASPHLRRVLLSWQLVPTAQEFRSALKLQGWRMTPQRQLILEAIARSRGHISADQVYRQVAEDYPDVNVTTVYRTLELLEELGFVRHTHFHGEPAQYERTDEPAHQHLVCTRCGHN